MVKIKSINYYEAEGELIVDVEEYPEKSWIFDISAITDIADFKIMLLDKEQDLKNKKQLAEDIKALVGTDIKAA